MKTVPFAPRVRRAFRFVPGFVPLLLLPACNRNESGAAPTRPRVALILKSLANEFFLTLAAGTRKHQSPHASDGAFIVLAPAGQTTMMDLVTPQSPRSAIP